MATLTGTVGNDWFNVPGDGHNAPPGFTAFPQATAGADTINGLGANDTIHAGGGGDILDGGDNDDTLFGEDGDDTLHWTAGVDTLDGGDGEDFFDVNNVTVAGNSIQGGAGDLDAVHFRSGAQLNAFNATVSSIRYLFADANAINGTAGND